MRGGRNVRPTSEYVTGGRIVRQVDRGFYLYLCSLGGTEKHQGMRAYAF